MRVIRAFFMCLGMFCAIPVPWRPWDERDRGLMIACLPIVGAVIGALWYLFAHLARSFLPAHLAAASIAALPLLLTGFIHLDGFMDTSDAVLSWRPRERRLEILKDPHCGSFAVISAGLLLLGMYAASADLRDAALRGLIFIPVASRCMSAIFVSALRPLAHSEYNRGGKNAAAAAAAAVMLAVCLVIAELWFGKTGALAVAAVVTGCALAMAWAYRTLGGVSGDLAGYALCIGELCGLAALAALGGGAA